MRFQLLGPVVVRRDDEELPLGPGKQRALLAALLLDRGRVVSTARLTEALWDGDPPSSATSNMRTYASGLRSVLTDRRGPRITSRSPGYVLTLDDDELDTDTFTELSATGYAELAAGQPARAAQAFARALALWLGSAGEDLVRSPYLDQRLAALEEQRLAVTEEWIGARQQLGEHADLVPELRRLTSGHPLRERLWCQLMLSLYHTGDVGGALAAYRRAHEICVEDLGVDPGPELVRLHKAILSRDPVLGGTAPTRFPAPRPALVVESQRTREVPRELPVAAPVFVGRDRELAEVVEDVLAGLARPAPGGSPTVVAVHGRPGAGKSALVLHAAARLAARFPDGQLYVDLRAGGADTITVLGRLLRALGVRDTRVPAGVDEAAARFRSVAADRRLLVVLDNAEDEAQVRPLLAPASQSAVLVTSASKLTALDCTAHLELGVLAPGPAGRLVAELAGLAAASIGRPLVELCGGLPLALRFVAARLALTPYRAPVELARQLLEECAQSDVLVCGDLRVPAGLLTGAGSVDPADPPGPARLTPPHAVDAGRP
ncbi:BTAD domain-containing putative transcriptional regulator [Catellatospora sp. KI3]|uniref:AfsR/SARP family transcriptional regulator n=1 Tax=Catellatospora sp. KI3 TaxID=3041620 RepID=UPI0024832C92|nr:BTAD domain-containing putative transcriptional regulator [Catellatospora sp. KI3]MDI1461423.1 BTAD domain-containing putative transcriptional regulator [Catellatospora sp. KI3]